MRYRYDMTESAGIHAARQRQRLTASVTDLDVARQRALLVGLIRSRSALATGESSLAELALLTETAGSDPVESILVRRERPTAATFIGSGKLRELVSISKIEDIDVVVFDNDLSPAQQRNLQQAFQCDVVDRVALILDIFAQHAHTKEGMAQVELAQLRYRLPRLRGKGIELSRLGAGIGTRGPGETKLETDRRRILERIRSTLFNHLTDAEVLVEDQLFATLDSTIRKLELPHGHPALISDTVGFVRDLPHEVVEAFKSTLEEIADADLLVHVVDASDADPDQQIASVHAVLNEIGAQHVDEITVFNKTDAIDTTALSRLTATHPDAVFISAMTGAGCPGLLDAIVAGLHAKTIELDLEIPYDRGDLLAELHNSADVLNTTHNDTGSVVTVRLPHDEATRFRNYVLTSDV